MDKNILVQKLFQKDSLLKMTNPQYKKAVDRLFQWMIDCDNFGNDRTSEVIKNVHISAVIRTNEDIAAAGIEEISSFLEKFPNILFENKAEDGKQVKKGEEMAIISGESRIILSLERTILNILQRMSGIATMTANYVKILKPVRIAATRKTPWMLLDKKAVAAGGGLTHRLDLSDSILIKDNHLQIIKNEFKLTDEKQIVSKVLNEILSKIKDVPVEIEVNTREGAEAALQSFLAVKDIKYGIIMLDNWKISDAELFMTQVRKNNDFEKILFEASGNISENNIKDWAKTGVDVVSSGALTHSAKAADLSLEIQDI